MKKRKLLIALFLILGAAGAARATKARDFYGYIYLNGAWTQIYIPYECPYNGWGCTYPHNGVVYQIYLQSGITFYPLKP
ncbi:DUF6520 family protein [Chitinophaga silvisoli]|uniref:Secreted protein n=1 Tax=Chitinophaga silvisoli TaxID=2291814 RepID=A0A3E1P488_9BACT|nr:DUF6520 family protein [Chitinophaga silvisoli]RFM35009.1 hypothetical protein DXN04_06300 [Chitinophaga silvisoli]